MREVVSRVAMIVLGVLLCGGAFFVVRAATLVGDAEGKVDAEGSGIGGLLFLVGAGMFTAGGIFLWFAVARRAGASSGDGTPANARGAGRLNPPSGRPVGR